MTPSATSLGRVWWDARRFGITPAKIRSRLFDHDAPVVVSNSLPKAGTHLLERALCLHPRLYRPIRRTLHDRRVPVMGDLVDVVPRLAPGHVLVTHLSYNEQRVAAVRGERVKSLFLIRDPRDIVVSQAHFVSGRPAHPHHATLAGIEDHQGRLRRVILGDPERSMPSIRQRLQSYAGWLASEALVVRYEDLVGVFGGGDADVQRSTLRRVFEHLGLELADDDVANLAQATFSGNSPTFRKGRLGQWQEQFDTETVAVFEEEVGDLIAAYGYGAHVPPSQDI